MSTLRRLRMNSRLTIAALAEAAGLSEDTIRDIETGQTRDPRVDTLGKLADALGVEPADIDPFVPAAQTAA